MGYAFYPPNGSGGGVPIYSTLSAFPPGATIGDLAVAADTGDLYEWNGTMWVQIAGPGAALTLGPFGNTPNADGLSLSNSGVLNMQPADSTHPGGVSSLGNLTSTPTTNLVVTGGTGAVVGTGTLLTLTGASLVEATSSVLTITGATNAVLGTGVSIQVKQASTSVSGYLSSTDWNTFNGKQAAGNYITALTGDITASGPGSVAATLATVNSNIGSFTYSAITVNAKGLITAASSGAAPVTTLSAVGAVPNANAGTITGNTLNLQPFDGTHPGVVTASGGGTTNFLRADGTWSVAGTGTVTTVSVVSTNGFAGTVATASTTPAITLSTTITGILQGNGTAISAATTTGTGNVVLSASPTLTGTIGAAALTLSTPLAIASGGTGAGAKAAAFDALSPMTTGGDLIYGGTSGTGTRLANGTAGQVLQSAGTTAAPTWSTLPGNATALKAPTVQIFNTASSGTYTRPSSPSPLYIRIRMVGGGGGGGGTGTSPNAGANGNNTTFSTLTAGAGGGGAQTGAQGGSGGSASGGSIINLVGGTGTGSGNVVNGNGGGSGGNSYFGGAGGGGNTGVDGYTAAINTGSGGGSAGGSTGVTAGRAGGGAGGYVESVITSPASTYSYSVGGGGNGGAAGTSGNAGGNGALGVIIVEEYYQ